MAENHRRTQREPANQSRRQMIQIDVLPDDVLLEIFDHYMMIMNPPDDKTGAEAWKLLVHVCRRWRNLVFASPRRLNLRLYCTPKTPAEDTSDVWPALPLIVTGYVTFSSSADNVITALKQSNRICEVNLWDLAGWRLETVLAAMQVPFPELTDLELSGWKYEYEEIEAHRAPAPLADGIPDSFLGGSAPRLQHFVLSGIPFPGLPKLLLSATHLVCLKLLIIPHSGYISPKGMVAPLSVLSSLETLFLEFYSPQFRPDLESRSLPPPKRSILPALDDFHFKGGIEYLEDLVTRIDTPRLKTLKITFSNQIDFDIPQLAQLAQFVNRTPKLRKRTAHVQFKEWSTSFALLSRSSTSTLEIEIEILDLEPNLQLSFVAHVCNFSSPLLSTVKNFYIEHEYPDRIWKNVPTENTLWLQLLRPFTALKNLYLSKDFAPGIAAALQELVGARITEVLPSLQNIFVEGLEPSGPFQDNIGQFVAARRLSDHPIAISVWNCQ